MQKVNDYGDRLVGGLLAQFQGKHRIEAFLRHVVAPQLQAIEDVFFALIDSFDLESAPSAILDQLGAVVGQVRAPGESDALYLRKIRARQARNRSRGTIEDLILIVGLLLPDKLVRVQVAETGTMQIVLALRVNAGLSADEEAMVSEFVEGSKEGAVKVRGICWYSAPTFALSGFSDPPFKGYDDGSGLVGGRWAKYFHP